MSDKSLDEIAERTDNITKEQEDNDDKDADDDFDPDEYRRDPEEYDGGWDTSH